MSVLNDELMPSSHDGSVLILTSMHGGAGQKSYRSVFGSASTRLHLLPLYKTAEKFAMKPRILSLDVDHPSILNDLGTPKLCVIGKINHHDLIRSEGFAMAVLAAVCRLRAAGVPIIVSYCDNLAPLSCPRGALYRDLLKLADEIIVPCQAMATLAAQWTPSNLPIHIINDPWQVRLQPYPELRLGEPLKIAWFGNANNILYFCRQIRELMKVCGQSSSTFQLDVLSNQPALDMAKSAFDSAVTSARRSWTLRLIPWDMAAQPLQLEEVLGPAHVAWLPSDPQNIIKAGVSHNRLVDSVRSGCIPLASPMVSYLELRKLALIGTDHNHILESLITNYPRLSVKYSGLRHNLLSRFEPSVNLRNWEDFLGGSRHKKAPD